MSNLFKSKRERERDERREKRRAFRQAEKAVDDVIERIQELEQKSKEQWEQARQALTEGRQAAANRLLVGYRACQVIMVKLEQKRWVFEQHVEKLHAAGSDEDFAQALAAINKIMNIDPDKIIDAFDDSQELLAEQSDADKHWNKLYEKEMAGAEKGMQDHIPSLEELTRQLDAEAGGRIAAEHKDSTSGLNDANLQERISRSKQRADNMLKNEEKT